MAGVFQNIDPPPPHRPASVPLVRGEDTLAGWRGEWGSIFWKTPGTALYSTYVSTYFVGLTLPFQGSAGAGRRCPPACSIEGEGPRTKAGDQLSTFSGSRSDCVGRMSSFFGLYSLFFVICSCRKRTGSNRGCVRRRDRRLCHRG
jgi:hypothetical protein